MKSLTLTFLAIGLITNVCFCQTDSIAKSKSQKTYRSNLKAQVLIFLPKWNFHLTYEYALSKKTSLGISSQYFSGIRSLDSEKTITLAPYFNYYFSSFNKNKYNRGFYGQIIMPFYYEDKIVEDATGTSSTGKNTISTKSILIGVGPGYQFILGKRFVANISLTCGPSIYRAQKESVIFTNWSKAPGNIFLFKNISLGFTF